jgi:hypothetical protein
VSRYPCHNLQFWLTCRQGTLATFHNSSQPIAKVPLPRWNKLGQGTLVRFPNSDQHALKVPLPHSIIQANLLSRYPCQDRINWDKVPLPHSPILANLPSSNLTLKLIATLTSPISTLLHFNPLISP